MLCWKKQNLTKKNVAKNWFPFVISWFLMEGEGGGPCSDSYQIRELGPEHDS